MATATDAHIRAGTLDELRARGCTVVTGGAHTVMMYAARSAALTGCVRTDIFEVSKRTVAETALAAICPMLPIVAPAQRLGSVRYRCTRRAAA